MTRRMRGIVTLGAAAVVATVSAAEIKVGRASCRERVFGYV